MKQTVFDPLRKKHVALTPEEQVRQSFIRWLNLERNYPMTLMASEYTLPYNRLVFRCDLIVFDTTLRPLLIVECKAPHVRITNAVVEQIVRYNLALKVRYLVITNGTVTFACRWNDEKGKYEFITEIPDYKTACDDSCPTPPENRNDRQDGAREDR